VCPCVRVSVCRVQADGVRYYSENQEYTPTCNLYRTLTDFVIAYQRKGRLTDFVPKSEAPVMAPLHSMSGVARAATAALGLLPGSGHVTPPPVPRDGTFRR
jgi:hypothetical protein